LEVIAQGFDVSVPQLLSSGVRDWAMARPRIVLGEIQPLVSAVPMFRHSIRHSENQNGSRARFDKGTDYTRGIGVR